MQGLLSRWMPIDASAHGWQIDNIIVYLHWLMAALFIGWSLYFIYVLYRFRAKANPKASYDGVRSHASSYIEVGVAIFEVVLLVGFAIPAWSAWVSPPETGDEFQVRVVAQQFAWNIHYPGPDGTFGRVDINLVDDAVGNPLGIDRTDPAARDDVILTNQLYFPVDRDIVVHLSSKDVIHSFFLPQMRVKQDAVPGMMVPVHFRALLTTPVESQYPTCAATKSCWEIACAQLCGLTHYRMIGYYNVLPQGEFDTWMAEQQARLAASLPPIDPDQQLAATADDMVDHDQAGMDHQEPGR